MSKEIFVTNAREPNTTSLMVATAMGKLGYPIKTDRRYEQDHLLQVVAGDEAVRSTFWKMTKIPEIESLREALEGRGVRESKELKRFQPIVDGIVKKAITRSAA